jgi:hypothetical protein
MEECDNVKKDACCPDIMDCTGVQLFLELFSKNPPLAAEETLGMEVNTFEGVHASSARRAHAEQGEAVVHHRVPKRRRDARARLHQAIFF